MHTTAIAAAFLALVGCASATDLRGNKRNARGYLTVRMQPELVAKSFADVQDEWRSQAQVFAECHNPANVSARNATDTTDCSASADAFGKSCLLVAKSMVDGSSGDGAVVAEYMSYVCNSSKLTGWKQEGCFNFAQALQATMTEDKYDNRENLNMTALCRRFWDKFSADEEKRVEKEREIAEKEREEREAEEKKRAEEAAEAAKKEAEEAQKKLEEQKKAEEAQKAEEARRQAEEAKSKAEEAARALEAKRQEAEKLAAEANRSKSEAQESIDVYARLANRTHGSMENITGNATVPGTASSAKVNDTANATSK